MSSTYNSQEQAGSIGEKVRVKDNPHNSNSKPYAGMQGIVVGYRPEDDDGDGIYYCAEYLIQFRDSDGKVIKSARIDDYDVELIEINKDKIRHGKVIFDESGDIIFEYFKKDIDLLCSAPCKVDIWGESGMKFIDFIVPEESIHGFDNKRMLQEFQQVMDKYEVPTEFRKETSGMEQILENGVKVIRYNFLLRDE